MRVAFRIITVIAIAGAIPPALAGGPPNTDPDWPCHQLKVTTFPLAAIWAGPALDLDSQAWRNAPEVADLAARMSQRRVPIAEVEQAVAELKAKEGQQAQDKLLGAFAAAFQDLTQQRTKVIEGLDRFGRRQRAMGDSIRAENEALQQAVDANRGQPGDKDAGLQQQLEWDLRVFNDRRQSIGFVCEVPGEIEHRIGTVARTVQEAL
jgi:hypothetical protein